jgi:hypothetical protein
MVSFSEDQKESQSFFQSQREWGQALEVITRRN